MNTPSSISVFKQRVYTLAKPLLALCFLALVFYQADLGEILGYLKDLSIGYILLACILVQIAQWYGALRMKYYYAQFGLQMSHYYAIALNYVCVLLNLVLVGAIGGDAYRVYLLKRRAEFPIGQGVKLAFSNRVSGLLIMAIIMLLMMLFIDFSEGFAYINFIAGVLLVICIPCYLWAVQLFFNETPEIAWGAAKYSFALQLFSIAAIAVIWLALGDGEHLSEFLVLFLAGSILGVLPISIGGLGIREFTFFYGATFLQKTLDIPLDPEFGVTISLIFFAINVLCGLPGLIWLHRISRMPLS